ncbi:MAG: hypothetical protein CMM52_15105 [Rhodospirillaceae bacterium]|nr:hypothetical protein [Rhodospirillaceae bacterium]|tara:strand:- start:21161 stop:22879 length:1719 start_codon:yes stop_codon:yes gene_type:complete
MWPNAYPSTLFVASLALGLIVSTVSSSQEKQKSPTPVDVKEALTKTTLLDCVRVLNKKPGWCELRGASISKIFPKPMSPEIKMVSGPNSVIAAWNGAAFDPVDLKMYFHGGGHRDYGGNEVYELDLLRGKWSRLTDPAYIPPPTKEVRCPVPVSGPPSSHTYDGFIFARSTRTIFMIPSVYGCVRGSLNPDREMWEFNPSKTETRNSLAPLTWRQRDLMPEKMKWKYYRTAEFEDGRLYVSNGVFESIYNVKENSWKRIGSRPNYGAGTSIYDPKRKGIWSVHRHGLVFTKPPKIGRLLSKSGAGVDGFSGIARTRDDKLIFWNGASYIHTYDPETQEWRLFDWAGKGPKIGSRVYSKWVWLPRYDVYVGYADAKSSAWVYRHPISEKGKPVNTSSIQPLLKKAKPGETVKIPPGIYQAGAIINKSLKLDMKDVRIIGPTHGKGVLLIKNAKGPVIIENFRTFDPIRCGNCAGIKIEGKNFNVTVRKSHISNAEMGILTDNWGGALIVEDTLIEDIGHARGQEPMHLIYAGIIDKLRVVRSTLRRSHYYGHIVKSRAVHTEISDTYISGGIG